MKTKRYWGKVNDIGDIDIVIEKIDTKNKKPVIVYQE